jgi:hypothetical protein
MDERSNQFTNIPANKGVFPFSLRLKAALTKLEFISLSLSLLTISLFLTPLRFNFSLFHLSFRYLKEGDRDEEVGTQEEKREGYFLEGKNIIYIPITKCIRKRDFASKDRNGYIYLLVFWDSKVSTPQLVDLTKKVYSYPPSKLYSIVNLNINSKIFASFWSNSTNDFIIKNYKTKHYCDLFIYLKSPKWYFNYISEFIKIVPTEIPFRKPVNRECEITTWYCPNIIWHFRMSGFPLWGFRSQYGGIKKLKTGNITQLLKLAVLTSWYSDIRLGGFPLLGFRSQYGGIKKLKTGILIQLLKMVGLTSWYSDIRLGGFPFLGFRSQYKGIKKQSKRRKIDVEKKRSLLSNREGKWGKTIGRGKKEVPTPPLFSSRTEMWGERKILNTLSIFSLSLFSVYKLLSLQRGKYRQF